MRIGIAPAGVLAGALLCGGAGFLVTNDDMSAPFPPSTISVYAIGADGGLGRRVSVSAEGNGVAGGYFGADRVVVTPACLFASNAQSENIAAFGAADRRLVGVFGGSHADTTLARDGIALATAGGRLYAAFSGAGTIGTFRIGPGCTLAFVGDVAARGLSGGAVEALAAAGRALVAAYGDGSIESFDLSHDEPVSHGDATYAAGRDDDFAPDAVTMTVDARHAIFGGGSTSSAVAVANLSTGRLGPARLFHLGDAWNAGSVRLSPDERVLYVSNSSGGRVTAAFFDAARGTVRPGCVSDPLRGFYTRFTHIGGVATQLPSGAGGLLYVPEFDAGGGSAIGIVQFSMSPGGCTLREVSGSPVAAGPRAALLSIVVARR